MKFQVGPWKSYRAPSQIPKNESFHPALVEKKAFPSL